MVNTANMGDIPLSQIRMEKMKASISTYSDYFIFHQVTTPTHSQQEWFDYATKEINKRIANDSATTKTEDNEDEVDDDDE